MENITFVDGNLVIHIPTFIHDTLANNRNLHKLVTDSIMSICLAHSTKKYISPSLAQQGQEGERILHDMLLSSFLPRDGYTIHDVHGQSHACDFLLQKIGAPDIRFEAKHYTNKVTHETIQKFRSDLIHLNNHGIIVSKVPFVSRGSFEIEFLTNGKIAIYISGQSYNEDTIREIVRMIYTLDDDSDCVILNQESVDKINDIFTSMEKNLSEMIKHQEQSLRLARSLSFETVKAIISGNLAKTQKNICEICHKKFKNETGLKIHIKTHK